MTPSDLYQFILNARRVTGRLPKLRECVEHFDGKTLNVYMALLTLPPDQADQIRQWRREEREMESARKA